MTLSNNETLPIEFYFQKNKNMNSESFKFFDLTLKHKILSESKRFYRIKSLCIIKANQHDKNLLLEIEKFYDMELKRILMVNNHLTG